MPAGKSFNSINLGCGSSPDGICFRHTHLAGQLAANFLFQCILYLVKRDQLTASVFLLQLEDVKAKLCLHHSTQLAHFLQLKSRIFKCWRHAAAAKKFKLASFECTAFVNGVFPRKLCKVSTSTQRLQQLFRLFVRFSALACKQYVSYFDLFLCLKSFGIGTVFTSCACLHSRFFCCVRLVEITQVGIREHFVTCQAQSCLFNFTYS